MRCSSPYLFFIAVSGAFRREGSTFTDSRFLDCGCALIKRKSTANRFTTIREAGDARDNAIREPVKRRCFSHARKREKERGREREKEKTLEKKRNDNGEPWPRHCWKSLVETGIVLRSPPLSLFLGCFACEVALKILPLVYESEVKSRFSGNIRRRNWYEPGKTVLAPRAVTRVLQKRKKNRKRNG